ncbi:short chain dehydrogenase [Hyaloraphidium curvatum]|nr:short chain dehydrogenase [Hyaloraphidium curvatum]
MATTMEDRLQAREPGTGRRRAILVTGAASGMGLEASRLFHSKGWFVVGVDVNLEDQPENPATGYPRRGLRSLEAELGGPSECFVRRLDVSDKAAFDALVDDLEKALPGLTGAGEAKLDVVFANAGIGRGGFWAAQPFQDHLDVVQVNFVGVMVTIYSSLRLMRNNPGGLVFSTSSSSAMYGAPGLATYAAAKHAVKGLTEALSVELEGWGLRAADTLPGAIATPILPRAWQESAPAAGAWRLVQPAAVADALWKSWVDDPQGEDALGWTRGRVHWYVPEELVGEVEAKLGAPGGAEVVKGEFRKSFWAGTGARLAAAGVVKAPADV